MNRQAVLTYWLLGSSARASSLSCIGGVLYSYGTPIAVLYKGHAIVSTRKYSRTTSCHQSAARRRLEKAGITCYAVYDVESFREAARRAGLDESAPSPVISDRLTELGISSM